MTPARGRPVWEAINRSDSAAVAMRATADALCGAYLDVWEVTEPWQQAALRLLALAGKRVVIPAIERFIATAAVDTKWARRITTEALSTWAVSLYRAVEQEQPSLDAIIIGAPNGGITHLATALGVPFLSQHFLTSFHDVTPPDDVVTYQAHGLDLAQTILARNRDLAIVNHYDPLHDRFLVKHVNHLRYKLLDLPDPYKAFILRNLRPGGTIIFSECRYSWPLYLLGERYWFQVGGLGGVAPQDFIRGEHPQIAALQAAAGTRPRGNWGLPGAMAFEASESEWGTLAPLHDQVELFARENAYEFFSLEGGHPEYFSHLAFHVWQRLFEEAGITPQGVLLETFTQVAPMAVREAALLPLWLPWNCTDSLDFLRRMREDLDSAPGLADKPVLWLPLPNFVDTFDMVPWSGWLAALQGWQVQPLGMQPRLYPADPRGLYATRQAVMDWAMAHLSRVRAHATVDMVRDVVRELRAERMDRGVAPLEA